METQVPAVSDAEERIHGDSPKSKIGAPIGCFPFTRSSQLDPILNVYRVYLPSEVVYHRKLKLGIPIMVGFSTVDNKLLRMDDPSELKALPCSELSPKDAGNYFVSAELWASHQVPKGMVALSNALMDAFENIEQTPNLNLALYEMNNGDCIEICKSLILGLRLEDPNSLPAVRTKTNAEENSGKASKAESASKHKFSFQTTPSKKTGQQRQSSTPKSTEFQKEVAKGMLREALHSGSRTLDLLKYVAMQLLEKRILILGNFIDIPFFGVHVRLEVIQLLTENGFGAMGRVCSTTVLELSQGKLEHDSQKTTNETSQIFEFAVRAVEALKEVEGYDGPEAAQAVRNAAIAGFHGRKYPPPLGGLQHQIALLRRLASSKLLSGPVPYSSSGVLLHGPPGTGKTALARAVAADLQFAFFAVNGPELVSEHLGHSEACLRAIFLAARSLAPTMLFIDEIDTIAPARERQQDLSASGVSSRLISTLASELDNNQGHEVIVVAATNRLSALDESLRRPGRIDQEIEVGVPSSTDRLDILKAILSTVLHDLDETKLTFLAEETHGFVGADLQALCNEAAMSALRKRIYRQGVGNGLSVSWEDFTHAKSLVKASGLRDASFEIPKLCWNDIGGYGGVKQQLKEVISWPRQFKASLLRVGAKPPRGVLMYGPPGCSKTALATAAANEAGMNFLIVKGPELYNKYVGETEKTLANIFQRARNSSPAIIFFDEIDGLAVSRDDRNNQDGVDINKRILSVLLQEMDKLEIESYEVVILAATNRPDMLDQALLRPGRLDRLLYLPLPSFEDRGEIFKVHLAQENLEHELDISTLVRDTEGYSGADIAALCQEARYIALEGDLNASKVSTVDFYKALKRISPTASRLDAQLINVYKKFKRNIELHL